jgi:3-hydroxybutyryl-CoA dehydratase
MLQPGQKFSISRSFSIEDVAAFCELSGDRGRHHTEPDESGRLVVHGLLVISVSTTVGAEIHYVAHTMNWMFTRPAFTGDVITATLEVVKATALEGRDAIEMSVRICNQDGKVVARGETSGVILHEGKTLRS